MNYFVQKLYGQNPGNHYIESFLKLSDNNDEVKKRIAVSVVKDETSDDLIIKMVNALPVSVSPAISFTDFSAVKNVTYTVLSGNPELTAARPVTKELSAAEAFSKELPPYAFVVMRIKTK